MIRTQILKHLPGATEAREEGAKEMSGEERWRRIGMSGSLRGRPEIIQSNISSPRGSEVPFDSQRGDGS